ncbi:MgtC/SapB family protein [Faunimonas sp. B44]|uniref:MgtC/SapB family protein n=1 Tax=Faunimonas sp. B44 TaxID=3461493 RepID=UPI0040446955
MDDLLASALGETHLPADAIVLRLFVAALLGGLIGIDREWRDRPAGLRTHVLTALAAAVFTVLTLEIVMSEVIRDDSVRADPVRVIEAVTAGVAFLAAGAIIQGRGEVRGLTTGAGMWLAGSLGVAAGLGYFGIGFLAAVLGLFVIVGLRFVERAAGRK